jgi:hypothetical protein
MNAEGIREAALEYVVRGWAVLPLKPRSKQPRPKAWTNLRIDSQEIAKHFHEGDNIGILLGEASGGLVDVDLDCSEVLKLADSFLPATLLVHGRRTKPSSHRWYRSLPPPKKIQKFCDLDGSTLVELRSTGGQTLVSPSVHPSGEPIVWECKGEPPHIDAQDLSKLVQKLAAAGLLARHWPAPGARHSVALALAGMLLRSGWSEEEAAHFVEAVAVAAGDEEARQRMRDVLSTATRQAAGRETTGGTTLSSIVGKNVVTRLGGWLHLSHLNSAETGYRQNDQADFEDRDPGPYRILGGSICVEQMKEHGPICKPLCNFVAQVEEELILDDGAETTRAFLVSGELAEGRRLPPIRVPATRFGGMSWVAEQWGFSAIVNAGTSTRDRLREAIQRLSTTPRSRRVFTHSGWREIDGEWVYLTASGAVGRDGFHVDLGSELSRYSLPHEPDDPCEAMRFSLKLLELAPYTVTVPLLAAIYRAPLATACPLDLSL